MNRAFGSGATGESDDDRTLVWLTLGLVVVILVVGGLALLVGRAAGDTAQVVASLGLGGPAGRPAIPTLAPVTAPQPAGADAATPVATPAFATGTAWYFGDGGSTGAFNPSIVVFNPNDVTLQGQITVLRETGAGGVAPQPLPFTVKPQARLTLPGTPGVSTSAHLTGTAPFFAERVAQSGKDALSSMGMAPATAWYVPLVESRFGYDDVLALANFNSGAARVSVSYLSGSITQTMVYTVPANSRLTVSMTQALAPLSSVRPGSPRGAVVRSDLPIVADQTTTWDGGAAGYASGGCAALSKNWYLPEGNTRPGTETTVAILNPGPSPAKLLVTYLPEGRQPVFKSYTVGAAAPLHLKLNGEMPDAAVALSLESDQAVAVSRVTYLGGGAGGHATFGATVVAREWVLPEAGTMPPALAFLIVMNPGTDAAEVTVTLFGEEGKPLEKRVSVAAASRYALALEKDVPPAAMSARVTSSQPVVVERVTYFRGSNGAMASMGFPR